jgi:thiol-disulfide isomerase/thioredoxin
MKKFALVTAFTLTLALLGCAGEKASTDAPAADDDGRKPIPSFELTRVAGGSLKASDLKGKVAVVDFWATWCNPCIAEIPYYNDLHKKYAGKNVEILGVTIESGSLDEIKPKVEEFAMQYPVVVGDDEIVEGFGGVFGYPTTFVVSPDGKIYQRYIGALPDKKERLEKDIETLLTH